jgi:hypothetical protein
MKEQVLMKRLLAIALSLVAVAGLTDRANAGVGAAASYDEATGNIVLELPPGIGVAGFEFPSGYNAITLVEKPENPAQRDAIVLAFFNANGLAPGTYNLGSLLPADIGASDLDSRIRFSSSPLGANPVPSPVRHVAKPIIPEPTAIALLGLASLCGLGVRRR